ncbi:DUF3861 domain-containing protein [Lysobacter gummosus]|uniref:DUF3861 domain-containing protein n=1 Tax=Lysobacter gummosus TaxID=262324 RepID=UPI003641383F
MKSHRYRITVQALDSSADRASVKFQFDHHDELFAIVDKVRRGSGYADDDAAALAVGLKLLNGVMLNHRNDPLFADVQPALRAFIGNLKARTATMDSDQGCDNIA